MSAGDGSLATMTEHDERTGLATEGESPDAAATGEPAPDDVSDDRVLGDGWQAPATGVLAVDEVLVDVQALDGRPVEEHVAVFEQAHERLRRALDPGHG